MIFGLVVVLLVMLCGAGVDVARAVSMRQRLSSALDAAALAVGAELNKTQDELELLAQNYFDANYPVSALGTPNPVVLTPLGDSRYSLAVNGSVNTVFLKLVDINYFNVGVTNQVTRSANNIEVGLVLDITGSMCLPGSGCVKLNDLKVAAKDMVDIIVQDVQTPYYTKLAIAPYASNVNVGAYASSLRGAITAAKTITGATWQTGANINISGVSKATPAVVTTSAAHGLVAGQKIWISGVTGMTQLNNKAYIVGTVPSSTTFRLKNYNNVDVNSTSYGTYTVPSPSSADIVRRCVIATVGVDGCEIQVTSTGHGFVNNQHIVIKNVTGVGLTAINTDNIVTAPPKNGTWQVSGVTANTFNLPAAAMMPTGTNPVWSYTSGGSAYCTAPGCEYQRFTSQTGATKVFQISNCVSERTGAQAYTDAAPSTAFVGRSYPASPKDPAGPATDNNPCLSSAITPLSTDKAALKAQIDAMVASGSTGGHLGAAWGWYLVSPTFGYLWPAASQPAAYGTDHLFKIVILMTDGEFNTMTCDGVISQDSANYPVPYWSNAADHKNCNATNGTSFSQAQTLCANMKAPGKEVIVYTVGFDIGADVNAQAIISQCATSAAHAYYPATGAELKASFQKIAQEISQLRLSQ